MLAEKLGVQTDIAGGVDTMDVAADQSVVRNTGGKSMMGNLDRAHPKPAAIEKNLEIGRKACSLCDRLVNASVRGQERRHDAHLPDILRPSFNC